MAQADINDGTEPGVTSGDLEELRRLLKENRVLKMERDLLSRACRHSSRGLLRRGERPADVTYRFRDASKADFPIRFMASRLGVSTSGFYEWRHRQAHPCRRRHADQALSDTITEIWRQSRSTDGSPRVWASSVSPATSGWVAGGWMERLMRHRRCGQQRRTVRRSRSMSATGSGRLRRTKHVDRVRTSR